MKCLLIDDHALFRQGLLLLLSKFPGDCIFLESENCETAFAEAESHQDIDLILLDLSLPGMNGLEGLTRLRELCPTTPIVVLSAYDHTQFIVEAMRRGARGFIPKSTPPEKVTAALETILAGGTYTPARGPLPPAPPSAEDAILTLRQREVLALLAQNKSNGEIAEYLGMRVNTVRVHVTAIFKALGVRSRNDAARVALEQGL